MVNTICLTSMKCAHVDTTVRGSPVSELLSATVTDEWPGQGTTNIGTFLVGVLLGISYNRSQLKASAQGFCLPRMH